MITLMNGYSALSLIFQLNWDRLLYIATILVALGAGAFLGSL